MTDLHMHSTFSDGAHTPEEMIEEGIRRGLCCIGLSDHAWASWDDAAMPKEKIEEYCRELTRLQRLYGDRIRILRGIERDYYTDEDDEYEYVIGSVHALRMPDGHMLPVDWEPENMERDCRQYFCGDWYALTEEFFRREADVVRKTRCDLIGHFDLVSKFNEQQRWFDPAHPRYRAAWQQAADGLLETGIPFEINTGAIARGYRTDAYPSREIRNYLRERGARLVLSSDAHSREHICFEFQRFAEEAE